MLLQSQSKTLHALVVELGAAARGFMPPTLSRAIHAQVLTWLNLGSPEIATAIHEAQDSPLCLSGLLGNRRPQGTQMGDRFYFRIAFLDGNLVQPLLKGFEAWGNQPLKFGRFPFALRGIYTLPGTHRLAGAADYHVLAKMPVVSQDLTLSFLSPTSFKQSKNVQPFPLPELVFGSLHRRWNVFAPEDLKWPGIEWNAVVSAYDLKTRALKLEGGAEIGAQGWVKYRFLEAEQAKVATTLAHFAFFAGVGRKTSMGMGQTKLEPLSFHQPAKEEEDE